MQRLVYSPKAFVFVKNSSGQVLDLTRFVTAGTVSRKINQVSTASVTLRNPNMIFTAAGTDNVQAFTPMDPITIYLMRVKGRPVRVFTGFLDKTVYLELFPGTITLEASCTLKKLLYTFFDPALPYTQEFLTNYGWFPDLGSGKLYNPNALAQNLPKDKNDPRAQLTDGSIGNLLYATLLHIGGWKSENIFIEQLPQGLVQRMQALYKQFDESNKLAKQEWDQLMGDIIGTSSFGAGGGTGSGSGGSGVSTGNIKGADKIVPVVVATANKWNVPARMILAMMYIETRLGANMHSSGSSYYGWVQSSLGGGFRFGPWHWQSGHPANATEANDLGLAVNAACASAAGWVHSEPALRNDIHAWIMKNQGVNCGNNPLYCSEWNTALGIADGLIAKYGHASQPASGGGGPTGGSSTGGSNPKITTTHKKRTPQAPIGAPIGNVTGAIAAPKIYAPIAGGTTTISSPYGQPHHGNPPHIHRGIDVPVPQGTACVAPTDGKIGSFAQTSGFGGAGGMVHFVFTQDTGQIKSGTVIGWGHVGRLAQGIRPGVAVKAGQVIAYSNHPAPHVHFIARHDSSAMDGVPPGGFDPTALFKALQKGQTTPTSGGSGATAGGGGGGGGSSTSDMASIAKATAFATELEWPSMEQTIEAIGLQGQKSLMNDKPLMPFIQQLTDASLRQFQSMPNGNFFGFYPDYFGEFYHRKPYWLIYDIEILDGRIELSDDSLATHVYVVGNTLPGADSFINKLFSAGVINIFNVFGAQGVLNRNPSDPTPIGRTGSTVGPGDGGHIGSPVNPQDTAGHSDLVNKSDAIAFLQRYGARPSFSEESFIRSPYFEAFMAYQRFMLLWSRQFLTTFTFTFMPELYPGGHVGFPDHGLQMYIDEVEHSWDYTSGFTTRANLSAPAALTTDSGAQQGITPIPDNMMMALTTPLTTPQDKNSAKGTPIIP